MNAIIPSFQAPLSCSVEGLPTIDEALGLLQPHFSPTGQIERLPPVQALGCVLAEDARAALTVPPCDRSAMDGFAFRYTDQSRLHQVAAVGAGTPWPGTVNAGECVAIATGAALPPGCDTVALREHCHTDGDTIAIAAKGPGANVRRRGEDFCAGDVLLPAGTRLNTRHLGFLAAAGIDALALCAKPKAAILSIGNELLGDGPGCIRDANRPMLTALCQSAGLTVTDLGILPDKRALLHRVLTQEAQNQDVIILSAGTSAGEEDHVRGAIADCGGQLLVCGAAIRPGKPISFGRIGQARVIALPGNPAAAYVTFLIMALPLLRRFCGRAPTRSVWRQIRVTFDHRKKPGLREFLRVRETTGADGMPRLAPCRDNGPAMLSSLAAADGLVQLDESSTGFDSGQMVSFASFADLEAA